MDALSLRLPSDLVEQTNQLANHLQLTKTEYIRKALESYNRFNEQRLFEQAIARSSQEVRKQPQTPIDEWDFAVGDGLHAD